MERFRRTLAEKLQEIEPACMLNSGIANGYRRSRESVLSRKGVETIYKNGSEDGNLGGGALAAVNASDFLSDPELRHEVFGPFTLIISCRDRDERSEVARSLEGQLTITFMATVEELSTSEDLISICREKAGRVIFNGVPTGVAVCEAMQHGGPYPAATDSRSTSVGTTAIRRFVRPIAFQDAPATILPDELQDGNPLGIFRIVNGSFTKT